MATTLTIEGIVRAANQDIPGATVYLIPATAFSAAPQTGDTIPTSSAITTVLTDINGQYLFTGQPVQDYWAAVAFENFTAFDYHPGGTVLAITSPVTGTLSLNGRLIVNDTTAGSGYTVQVQRLGSTNIYVTTDGQVGIGRSPQTKYSLDIQASPICQIGFHSDIVATHGAVGQIINKTDKTSTIAPAICYFVGGKACWQTGMDFDTDNSDNGGTGNSDMVMLFDYTSGWNDFGVRTFPLGADVFRVTPAEKSTTGKCTQFQFAGQAANRVTSAVFAQFIAASGFNGLEINAFTAGLHQHLLFTDRTPLAGGGFANECLINYNQKWICGLDYGAGGTRNMKWVDNATTGSIKTRMFLQGTDNEIAKFGLNTDLPLGYMHVQTNSLSGANDTIQTIFTGGYDLNTDLRNRRVNIQQMVGNNSAVNCLFFNGGMSSGSTVAGGVSGVVSFSMGLGMESTDTGLSLISFSVGGETPFRRVVKIGNNQLGFFDTAVVSKQAGASAGGIATITDAAAKASITALQAALAAYGLVTSPA